MSLSFGKSLLFCVVALFTSANAFAGIDKVGTTFEGIRDFREVMPNALYRGGANNGKNPLKSNQLKTLCENNIGETYYLYSTNFSDSGPISCSRGSMSYNYKSWKGNGRAQIHQAIYNTVKSKGKPVFIHCWYGIHATGAIAATALMQFCGMPASRAVEYWKVGIAPKLQYPEVITDIQNFRPNPALTLTEAEKAEFCPSF